MYNLCTCSVASTRENMTLRCGLLAGHPYEQEHWALVPPTGKLVRWPQWDGMY